MAFSSPAAAVAGTVLTAQFANVNWGNNISYLYGWGNDVGAWTPTLTGDVSAVSVTYSAQAGWYMRIGKLVAAGFYLILSNKGTISTTLRIAGLPVASGFGAYIGFDVSFFAGFATSVSKVSVTLPPSANYLDLWYTPAAGGNTVSALGHSDVNNNLQLIGLVVYPAAAVP